jgi:hypothetical protein
MKVEVIYPNRAHFRTNGVVCDIPGCNILIHFFVLLRSKYVKYLHKLLSKHWRWYCKFV